VDTVPGLGHTALLLPHSNVCAGPLGDERSSRRWLRTTPVADRAPNNESGPEGSWSSQQNGAPNGQPAASNPDSLSCRRPTGTPRPCRTATTPTRSDLVTSAPRR